MASLCVLGEIDLDFDELFLLKHGLTSCERETRLFVTKHGPAAKQKL